MQQHFIHLVGDLVKWLLTITFCHLVYLIGHNEDRRKQNQRAVFMGNDQGTEGTQEWRGGRIIHLSQLSQVQVFQASGWKRTAWRSQSLGSGG